MPSAVPDGSTTPYAVAGGPSYSDSGNTKVPVSLYIKDGNDLSGGATTDAAVTGDTAGSRSAKLRGLNKILFDIWDSTNHLFAFNLKQVGATAVDTNSGNKSAGTQRVVLATDQPALTNAWQMQPVAGTSGAATPYHLISAATVNATNVKGSAGTIWGLDFANTNAAVRFIKLYDKATAPASTDTPVKTIEVPANGQFSRAFPVGIAFTTGIGFRTTTGLADNDTGAVGAGELSIDLEYK
jgi:hypothetical protein